MLLHVSEGGGNAEPLITATEGESQRWPQLLPAAKAVLFTSGSSGTFNEATIVVQRLTDGNRKTVQRGGYFGRYASGHLLYIHDGTLFAVPFDIKRLEVNGAPAPVFEHVAGGVGTGAAQFAVAEDGTAVYLPGEGVQNGQPIVWLSRNGEVRALRATPSNWSNPRFSPDGQRLAVDIAEGSKPHIWVYDWSRDTPSKLTFSNGGDVSPVWTPDGRRIAFTSASASGYTLSWQRADGSGEPQRLAASKNQLRPTSWHPSGKWLAFQDGNPQTGMDLMLLPMEGNEESGWKPGQPIAFLRTPSDEIDAMFSPDGRWIAYASNESGRNEVWVRPFPGPGGRWQVSNGGGFQPMWSRKRDELLYVAVTATGAKVMAVTYTVEGNSFSRGAPHEWSPVGIQSRPRLGWLDLHPDGERVAANVPQGGLPIGKQDRVVFIFNFFDELRRVVPVTKP
jgi:serine/threonine-protein kinase